MEQVGQDTDKRRPIIEMDDDQADGRSNATSTEPAPILTDRELEELVAGANEPYD